MAEPNSFAPLLILTNAIQLFNGETQIPVKFRKNPRILHHKGKKRYPVPEHSGTGYRFVWRSCGDDPAGAYVMLPVVGGVHGGYDDTVRELAAWTNSPPPM